jgi:hypothetical protein
MQEKIYIYIDESGDTGLKRNQGSSEFFVVALVIITHDSLFDISKTLQNLIGYKEIKFSKSSSKDKSKFFEGIKSLDFNANIFVFNKIQLKLSYEEYLVYTLKESLDADHTYSVFIDGLNKNSFSGKSIEKIKRNFKNINRVYLIDSKKNYMIQLADMLAGLANALYKGKRDYESFHEKIKGKIKTTHIR